jgi:hypothetical protein
VRLHLRDADVPGELEVVTDEGEIVEGIIGVAMNWYSPGGPTTTVTVALRPEDVLSGEDAAETREMRTIELSGQRAGKTARQLKEAAQWRHDHPDEEVHEHPLPPASS